LLASGCGPPQPPRWNPTCRKFQAPAPPSPPRKPPPPARWGASTPRGTFGTPATAAGSAHPEKVALQGASAMRREEKGYGPPFARYLHSVHRGRGAQRQLGGRSDRPPPGGADDFGRGFSRIFQNLSTEISPGADGEATGGLTVARGGRDRRSSPSPGGQGRGPGRTRGSRLPKAEGTRRQLAGPGPGRGKTGSTRVEPPVFRALRRPRDPSRCLRCLEETGRNSSP
jgi:hypothetical protein